MVVVRTQEPLTFVPRDWILWFHSFVPVATEARVAPGVIEPVHVAQHHSAHAKFALPVVNVQTVVMTPLACVGLALSQPW